MLNSSLIQHSHSSFTSPVLSVKKDDGSWRFCADYRQLNAITTKEKFSILLVDGLLLEQEEAAPFSKVDLGVGYH